MRVQAQRCIMPNVFDVGNVVKSLIGTRMIFHNRANDNIISYVLLADASLLLELRRRTDAWRSRA
jgi:hypothetical protein